MHHISNFVPELALREALVNAICHKRYQSGVPIQVSVYEDKLYIANDGCLPENWTLDNLMRKHASKPYNPNIANIFYYAGFIESWGRGIEKIGNACESAGVPMPVLAGKMGVSRKTIANYIKSLRDKNLIERIGSDRKGYWKIKSL